MHINNAKIYKYTKYPPDVGVQKDNNDLSLNYKYFLYIKNKFWDMGFRACPKNEILRNINRYSEFEKMPENLNITCF